MDNGIRSVVSNFGSVISHLAGLSIANESLGKTLTYLSDSVIMASEFRSNAALDALSVLGDTIISSSNDNLFSSRQVITEAMMGNITYALTSFTSIPKGNISVMASALHALENVLSNYVSEDISQQKAEELYAEEEEITDDEVAEEVQRILNSPEQVLEPAVGKKPKAIRQKALEVIKKIALYILMSIMVAPVIERIEENTDKKLGISQMWEESGVFEWIDNLFGLPQRSTLTEDEAKSSVSTENTGNQSKRNREDLLAKIQAIRTYISSAPQDENTDNLLTYLSDLERDVNGKKYGLVFEEHQETIDTVLAEHTPVLTEEPELLIENGGEMNFLLEGDNLATLRLLEKTHRGRIDLIYIDPPYNTGNKDFVYDDTFVDKTDTFIHSKWLSFISERLVLASRLLSQNGSIVISIGYQEVHNLVMLCQGIFSNKQVVCVTVQTSGGKPNGGFTYTQEYLVFIVPEEFAPNAMSFTGGIERSPFEGLTLSTFDKTTRPNQTYPIFIDKTTMHIVGVGKSLTERINDGTYTGELKDFAFDYDEAPEGAAALWPVSSKGADCVWRLISSRLLHDWERGYIKISKNKSKANPNEFSVQYLPDGVIKKVELGELEVLGREDNMPTLKFGKNETVGSEIPTIWTEKDFFTTKGSSYVRELFGDKRFPYPKPLEYIVEILRAASNDESIILDFFAGSGTTGEAAMVLNKAGTGKRKFILCTNNENNICRNVTYERIKRVIEREGYAASLKYYRIDYVPINEQLYYEYADELLRHVRELVELENGVNFIENAEIAIVLTDGELADFIARPEAFAKCHTLYLGHDILPTGEQDAIIKERGIRVNIIPDYYYRGQEG